MVEDRDVVTTDH